MVDTVVSAECPIGKGCRNKEVAVHSHQQDKIKQAQQQTCVPLIHFPHLFPVGTLTFVCVCVCMLTQLSLTLCDRMDCSWPGSSVHGVLQARILGVSCHALLQGIFPTQGLNQSLPHLLQ